MVRPVIKSFRDMQDGGKIYAPTGRRTEYDGPREDELFEMGYLGEFKPETEGEILEKEDETPETEEFNPEIEDENFSGKTNAQLMEILDDRGIEYPSKANKETLLKLIGG